MVRRERDLAAMKAKGEEVVGSIKKSLSTWGQHIKDQFAKLRASLNKAEGKPSSVRSPPPLPIPSHNGRRWCRAWRKRPRRR